MARLTQSYQDYWQKVAEFLGLVASGTAPTGQDLTDVEDIVARGLRQFLYSIDQKTGEVHEWSFLIQHWTFNIVPGEWKHALPLDFAELLTDIVYDSGEGLPPLVKRSGQQIKDMRTDVDESSWPNYYAVVPSKYDLGAGSSYELWLYPKPDKAYILSCFYRIDPLRPSSDADLMVGGISATEAILESCLAVAEHWSDEMATIHHAQKAAELIQTLIRFDAGKIDTDKIGNLYRHRREWPYYPPRGITNISTDNIYTDT